MVVVTLFKSIFTSTVVNSIGRCINRCFINKTFRKTANLSQPKRQSRKRQIIWFNPPYSANVKTNVGRNFMRLVDKHFPRHHKYHKLFNRNNIKLSYSCMPNMNNIIRKHKISTNVMKDHICTIWGVEPKHVFVAFEIDV